MTLRKKDVNKDVNEIMGCKIHLESCINDDDHTRYYTFTSQVLDHDQLVALTSKYYISILAKLPDIQKQQGNDVTYEIFSVEISEQEVIEIK